MYKDIRKEKQLIAALIEDVLKENISVSYALSHFPDDRDEEDIQCAFSALMYREADEDIRAKDSEYAEVQDEYLSDIAQFLKDNIKIPENIVKQYKKYNPDNLLADNDNSFKGIIKKIKRMINF